jgi:hypothetical protein
MKIFTLNKMCLNKICNKIHRRKYLAHAIPIWNCLKQEDASVLLIFNFAVNMPSVRSNKTKRNHN